VIRLQADAISITELVEAVGTAGDGAVAVFLGTVRNENRGRVVLYLEYQAYDEMAVSEMAAVAEQARRQFAVGQVAIVHRTGRLEIGQASVAVAVAAPHRGAAMDACRFIIDTLKQRVPIWKKEVFEGGEVWIEGAGETPRPAPD
jgi:molybdopterin synthase catalytic subunit